MRRTPIACFTIIVASLVIAVGLAACNGGSMHLDTLDEASGVLITCEDAGAGHVVTSRGAISIAEGEHLCVSPDFTEGGVHLTITATDDGATAYDEDVSGRESSTADIEPGEYDVRVNANGATGMMSVFAQSDALVDAVGGAAPEGLEETIKSAEGAVERAEKSVAKAANSVPNIAGTLKEYGRN